MRGLRAPRALRHLFVRTKRCQKAAGGEPPVPPASPSGRYSMCCLFALCCSWADSTDGAYPSSAAAYRLPTGFIWGEATGGVRCRFTAQLFGGSPAADSLPLRGRQAELDESQTTRSEPRRKRSFTGHRSSSFAERVRKSPAEVDAPGSRHCRLWRQRPLGQRKRCLGRPREGARGLPGALLVTFPAWEK